MISGSSLRQLPPGVKVLLTWDERLRTVVAPVLLEMSHPELSTLRVIDPDHLVIHLDELAHAAAYRPQVLSGSRFSTELANSASESVLLTFLDRAGGEAKNELKARLHTLAQLLRSHSIIRDAGGVPAAMPPSSTARSFARHCFASQTILTPTPSPGTCCGRCG